MNARAFMGNEKRKQLRLQEIAESGKIFIQSDTETVPKKGLIFPHEDGYRVIAYHHTKGKIIRVLDIKEEQMISNVYFMNNDGAPIMIYSKKDFVDKTRVLAITGTDELETGEINYNYSRMLSKLIKAYSKNKK